MNSQLTAILVLVIGVPLNVVVTTMLGWKLHKAPHLRVLRERFVVALAVLFVVALFGLIFLNNDTLPPPLDTEATKFVTRAFMLGLATIPALYWLWLYRPKR